LSTIALRASFSGMKTKMDFFAGLQFRTEAYLTWRRHRLRIKREKQKAKNPIIDWLEAFIWAAGVVLLVNQYIFQAYQIPSGSMIDTLLIGDRIFVNKLVYGPELLPGIGKLPSPISPKRLQVVIFENPSYLSRGPGFDVAQRILYMLTLSLVDIDRDENGQPRAHFLIKRAVGMGGDTLKTVQGDLYFRFPGESDWTSEKEYKAALGTNYHVSRLMTATEYPALLAAGRKDGYADIGLPPSTADSLAASEASAIKYPDYIAYEAARLEVLRSAFPQEKRYSEMLARHTQGWYVPEGRLFPMGDNRDNSRDARYFGPVKFKKVLGQAMFIYWPLNRIGKIR